VSIEEQGPSVNEALETGTAKIRVTTTADTVDIVADPINYADTSTAAQCPVSGASLETGTISATGIVSNQAIGVNNIDEDVTIEAHLPVSSTALGTDSTSITSATMNEAGNAATNLKKAGSDALMAAQISAQCAHTETNTKSSDVSEVE
jgi:hypothetical protein